MSPIRNQRLRLDFRNLKPHKEQTDIKLAWSVEALRSVAELIGNCSVETLLLPGLMRNSQQKQFPPKMSLQTEMQIT
jgi:hypothetical protein